MAANYILYAKDVVQAAGDAATTDWKTVAAAALPITAVAAVWYYTKKSSDIVKPSGTLAKKEIPLNRYTEPPNGYKMNVDGITINIYNPTIIIPKDALRFPNKVSSGIKKIKN